MRIKVLTAFKLLLSVTLLYICFRYIHVSSSYDATLLSTDRPKARPKEICATSEYPLNVCTEECQLSIKARESSAVIQVGNQKYNIETLQMLHLIALEVGTCQISSSFTCYERSDFDAGMVNYLRTLRINTPIIGVLKPDVLPIASKNKKISGRNISKDLDLELNNLGIDYDTRVDRMAQNGRTHFFHAKIEGLTVHYPLKDSAKSKTFDILPRSWLTSFYQGAPIVPNLTDVPPTDWDGVPKTISDDQNNRYSTSLHWTPPNCVPKWTIAIIIPVMNRESHLRILISNLFPFLQQQRIAFSIFVVDQSSDAMFNKARIMNIGYLEARRHHKYDCYVFHDVDMVPENLCNLYTCGPDPRHLTLADDKHQYNLYSSSKFGGAIILNESHMNATNGFSNIMWGWGGEDDNMLLRVLYSGYQVVRYPPNIGLYKTIKHGMDSAFSYHADTTFRQGISNDENARCREFDGFRNQNDYGGYKILGVEKGPQFTRVRVSLTRPPNGNIRALWTYEMQRIMEMCRKI